MDGLRETILSFASRVSIKSSVKKIVFILTFF